jgi:transposase
VILPGGGFVVFVATRPVDFRKGMDGLAAVVQQQLRLDPFCGAVFVFRAKRADRVKLLVWDGSGLTLIYKRLDQARFVWPRIEDGMMRLSLGQLRALFEGLDWKLREDRRSRSAAARARGPRAGTGRGPGREDRREASRTQQRRVNRGALPKHLPREEVVIEPESTTCPCCQGAMHRIGEDVAERLDMIPAAFRVIVTRRSK